MLILTLVAVTVSAAACGGNASDGDSGNSEEGGDGGASKVAFLLPESKTTRYEAHDRPLFEAAVEQECPECEILYSNADQDASKQQQQAEAAITNGADVLVLDPVDSDAGAVMAQRAKQADVPIVAYERLIFDADLDWHVSYDNEEVGRIQARSLLSELESRGESDGTIVMVNGSPTDNNARLFKQGAHSVFDDSGVEIGREYDTPDWSPDKAQQQMEQAIVALGEGGFAGVYAANDGTAGGAISAMKGAGIDPSTRPTTGQDAELAAIQRILRGEQFMTIYKAIKPEAEDSAKVAVALAKGNEVPEDLVNTTVDNGEEKVPTLLYKPEVVTIQDIQETIVKDDFFSAEEICTDALSDECEQAGIQ